MKKNNLFFKKNDGFTLLELIVSISIFVIVSTVVLANYSKYSGRVSIENLAHEIAISIRQAQVFGQNIREFGAGSNQFPSYGVHFDSTNKNSFVFFADVNGNKKYDSPDCVSVGTECIERFIIQTGSSISDLCGDTVCSRDSLDVTFTRPDPDAYILSNGAGSPHSTGDIVVTTNKGESKKVVVSAVGQISIK